MPIDKFGQFERRNDAIGNNTRWRGMLRRFVRENALCRNATDFDAKSLKIRCVGEPEADTDAINKRYLEQRVETLTNRLKELNDRIDVLRDAIGKFGSAS